MSSSNNAVCTKDYGVGYGRPPKQSQWRPGQSGNSKGSQPRERLDFGVEVGRVLRKKVPFTVNGKIKMVTCLEALAHRLVASAGTGNASALKEIIKLLGCQGGIDGGWTQIVAKVVFEEEENRLMKLSEEVRELAAENARLKARLGAQHSIGCTH